MKVKLATVITAGLAFTAIASRADLNFAGINNVQFNSTGTSFQLNPITGSSVTPQFDFTGADAGLTGWITGAPWVVNMAGLSSITLGGLTYEQAPVTGGGQLDIFDGSKTLTGDLSFTDSHPVQRPRRRRRFPVHQSDRPGLYRYQPGLAGVAVGPEWKSQFDLPVLRH
jgi:hypothetical protein